MEVVATGKIILYIGPMYAGKTRILITTIQRYLIAGIPCLVCSPNIDTRYPGDCITSHDGYTLDAIKLENLMDLDLKNTRYKVIGIDEAQFFPDLLQFCLKAASEYGIKVIVAALDGDFKKEPFENISKLIPHADKIKKVKAVCIKCGSDAPFTSKIKGTGTTVEIGGSDLYEPRCRRCYELYKH